MWRDEALLLDMLIAARHVRDFASNLSQDGFASDILVQSAVQHQLQIIGEAASKVSEDLRKSHPEVPWTPIIGLRHRLVHDYPRIDLMKV